MFGANVAILAGDALLALAFDVLTATGHRAAPEGVRMLGAAVLDLLEGQSSDLDFERRTEVEVHECLSPAVRAEAERRSLAVIDATWWTRSWPRWPNSGRPGPPSPPHQGR